MVLLVIIKVMYLSMSLLASSDPSTKVHLNPKWGANCPKYSFSPNYVCLWLMERRLVMVFWLDTYLHCQAAIILPDMLQREAQAHPWFWRSLPKSWWLTMAVSIAGLRRNIKNVAHNYTDAQVSRTIQISATSMRTKIVSELGWWPTAPWD